MKTAQIIYCTGRNITFQCNDQCYTFSKVDTIRKLLDAVGGKRAYLCGRLLSETQSMCNLNGNCIIYIANKRVHDQKILRNECITYIYTCLLLEQCMRDLEILGTGKLHKRMRKLRKHIRMNLDYLSKKHEKEGFGT